MAAAAEAEPVSSQIKVLSLAAMLRSGLPGIAHHSGGQLLHGGPNQGKEPHAKRSPAAHIARPYDVCLLTNTLIIGRSGLV